MSTFNYQTNTTHAITLSITKEDRQNLEGTMAKHNTAVVMDRIKKQIIDMYDAIERDKNEDFYDKMAPRWAKESSENK